MNDLGFFFFRNLVIVVFRREMVEEMKFNFLFIRIFNRKGFVGSGLKCLFKIGILVYVGGGWIVFFSVVEIYDVVWFE